MDDVVLAPARMLNEVVYCPRLAYLEWVQGEFVHNPDTEEGRLAHKRVDKASRSGLVAKDDNGVDQGESQEEEPPAVLRSLHLSSEALQLTAVIDLCELDGKHAVVVEYKKGHAPHERPWEADQVQVCAQALLLREHGYHIDEAVVYYAGSKSRVRFEIGAELIERTLQARNELLSMLGRRTLPPPLVDDPKCPRCSLVGICLPDETHALRTGRVDREVRRLLPARTERDPVYVQAQGAKIGKREECLDIWTPEDGSHKVRLMEIESLNLLGAVQMTAQAQAALLRENIPVCHFSYGGWFNGMTTGLGHPNVDLRRAQFRVSDDAERCLTLAKAFVLAKVRNHRTLLRRNLKESDSAAMRQLNLLTHKIQHADSQAELLGLEGTAARIWFERLPLLLRPPDEESVSVFHFEHRNRRPPRDPVNAVLGYGYGILVKELTVILERAGLEPRLGFYHQPRSGRPALALDLMEEFRPLIVDSMLLTMVNRGELKASHFTFVGDAVSLSPAGRKKVLAAYERRMDHLIEHPLFGYTISYRRVLDVQARLLGRYLLGELDIYQGFVTR